MTTCVRSSAAGSDAATPDRRAPAVVTGASSGHRRRPPPRPLGRGRAPGGARRPAGRPLRGDAADDPRRRRRGGRPGARPHRRRVDRGLRRGAPRRARPDRGRRLQRRRGAARPASSSADPDDFARQVQRQPARRPAPRPRASCPAWSSAGGATSSSSRPTSCACPARTMAVLRHGEGGPRGPGPGHADGARGHRRAGRRWCAPARRPPSRATAGTRTTIDEVHGRVGAVGPHAPPGVLRPEDVGRRRARRRVDAPGHPPHPRRGRARGARRRSEGR